MGVLQSHLSKRMGPSGMALKERVDPDGVQRGTRKPTPGDFEYSRVVLLSWTDCLFGACGLLGPFGLGPLGPGPYGPSWALMRPWALMGRALMGRPGPNRAGP